MRTVTRLKYLYLAYLSKPRCDRVLYRAIKLGGARRILQIGLGTGARALRLINLASQIASEPVRFVAIDLFEARPADASDGLSLKEAHRLLKSNSTSAQLQLIPGDPASALARSANALQNMDLVVISADHSEQSLGAGWFYLPRMLHAHSAVYVEQSAAGDQQGALTLLAADEIAARATASRPRRAA